MSPQEISQYVVTELNRGVTQEEIVQALMGAGYSEEQITTGFRDAGLDALTTQHNQEPETANQTKWDPRSNTLVISLGVIATLLILSVVGVLIHSATTNTQNKVTNTASQKTNGAGATQLDAGVEADSMPSQKPSNTVSSADTADTNLINNTPAETKVNINQPQNKQPTTLERIKKTLSQTQETVFEFSTGEKIVLPATIGGTTASATIELFPVPSEDIYAASREVNISFDGDTGWSDDWEEWEKMLSRGQLIEVVLPNILENEVTEYLYTNKEFEIYDTRFFTTISFLSRSGDILSQSYAPATHDRGSNKLESAIEAYYIALMFNDEFLEGTDSSEFPTTVSIQFLTIEPEYGMKPGVYKRPEL